MPRCRAAARPCSGFSTMRKKQGTCGCRPPLSIRCSVGQLLRDPVLPPLPHLGFPLSRVVCPSELARCLAIRRFPGLPLCRIAASGCSPQLTFQARSSRRPDDLRCFPQGDCPLLLRFFPFPVCFPGHLFVVHLLCLRCPPRPFRSFYPLRPHGGVRPRIRSGCRSARLLPAATLRPVLSWRPCCGY